MNLPGLLVEYLINGCIAMIWLSTFNLSENIFNLTEVEKLLLIPIAYVLGMFIDFIAWFVTKPFKKLIRNDALKVVSRELIKKDTAFDISKYKLFWEEKVRIEMTYSELNKELGSRSSRDRIARGTILNLVAITICYWDFLQWVGILLVVVSIFMWIKFEHYNRCFEVRAAIIVREDQ